MKFKDFLYIDECQGPVPQETIDKLERVYNTINENATIYRMMCPVDNINGVDYTACSCKFDLDDLNEIEFLNDCSEIYLYQLSVIKVSDGWFGSIRLGMNK